MGAGGKQSEKEKQRKTNNYKKWMSDNEPKVQMGKTHIRYNDVKEVTVWSPVVKDVPSFASNASLLKVPWAVTMATGLTAPEWLMVRIIVI